MTPELLAEARKIGSVRPRHSPLCTLEVVAYKMQVTLRGDKPVPRIRYENETPLSEFQDAAEPQWGFRPPVLSNLYSVATNTIYLIDDSAYYLKLRRFIDDSLAHEYAHFIQVHYKGDPSMSEEVAIDVQNWYREHYMRGVPPPGAPRCL